ncbi:hypothetical protein DdX_05503 [Ditylenchus destructor]|uniref:Uncharacterized protein n=1 Tax=Ditylenchus destructor TaxID=166010 RepID=A0AAD4R6P3_9BILA|nr:hypothetical protein DdX_05503 [Ditylenchus destructor]
MPFLFLSQEIYDHFNQRRHRYSYRAAHERANFGAVLNQTMMNQKHGAVDFVSMGEISDVRHRSTVQRRGTNQDLR